MSRLADDEITIRVGHETIFLRPTLRAAFRLERRFEGFDHIIRGVAEQNLTVMSAVIRETADSRSDLLDLLERYEEIPLNVKAGVLVEPLLSIVLSLAGVDEIDTHNEPDEIEEARVSFAEHHARLFRIATGWLGWTPSEVWNATPAEIMEAYQGRIEMLKAVFGSSEGDKPKTSGNMDADAAAFFGSLARAA